MANPSQKPAEPDRVAYALERRPGNTWVVVQLTIRGASVVSAKETEPDVFQAQLGRVDNILRRLV